VEKEIEGRPVRVVRTDEFVFVGDMTVEQFLGEVAKRGPIQTSKITTEYAYPNTWFRYCCEKILYKAKKYGIDTLAYYEPIKGAIVRIYFFYGDGELQTIPEQAALEMINELPFGQDPAPHPNDIEFVSIVRGSPTDGRYNLTVTLKNNTPRDTHAFVKAMIGYEDTEWHGVYQPISANGSTTFTFTLPKMYFVSDGIVQTGIITVTDTENLMSGGGEPTPPPTKGRLSKWRPCPPGTGITVKGGLGQGTFGAVVLKNGMKKILSNNHVLAAFGNVAIGSPVYQPPYSTTNVLAKLESFVPVSQSTPNKVDCALASPVSQDDITPNILVKNDSLDGSLIPKGVKEAYVDQRVVKSGSSSGYTEGAVLFTDGSIKVNVPHGTGVFIFDDIIIGTKGLASEGDSGSLLMDKDTLEAVGLIFASSSTTSAACRIQSILEALGCTLYTEGAPPYVPPAKAHVTFTSNPTGANILLKKK
jgi:hypothetical protein